MIKSRKPLDTYNRQPPYNLEAECGILSIAIMKNDSIPEILEKIEAGHFYDVRNQELMHVIDILYLKGEPVNFVTLAEELKRRETYEKVGDVYILELISHYLTDSYLKSYCQIIRDAYIKRQLIEYGINVVSKGYDNSIDAREMMTETLQSMINLTEKTSQKRLNNKNVILVANKIRERSKAPGTLLGYTSGFPLLDCYLNGFEPGGFYLIAARPSMGKSNFAMNIAWHAAHSLNLSVMFFSLEMNSVKVITRLISSIAFITLNKLQIGDLNQKELEQVDKAAHCIDNSRLTIDETPGLSAIDICTSMRRLKAKNKLDMVIIDHLTEMKIEGNNPRFEISENARILKQTGKQLGVPVLLLTQLNRAVESRQTREPQLADLRETGVLEELADAVIMLYRPSYYDDQSDPRQTNVYIRKNRDGELGTIPLQFFGEYCRFIYPEK